jgi:hypothetical protein
LLRAESSAGDDAFDRTSIACPIVAVPEPDDPTQLQFLYDNWDGVRPPDFVAAFAFGEMNRTTRSFSYNVMVNRRHVAFVRPSWSWSSSFLLTIGADGGAASDSLPTL